MRRPSLQYTLMVAVFVLAVLLPSSAAQAVKLENPLNVNTIPEVLSKVLGALQILAIPVVAIMVLVGAFQMITSVGNTEKFMKGMKTLEYAAIGFVAILVAEAVPDIIKSFFA